MNINAYEKNNSINSQRHSIISDMDKFEHNDLLGNLSHVSFSEETLNLFKSKSTTLEIDTGTSEEHTQYFTLKRIVKYTIGISIFIGGLFSILKLSHSNNATNNSALKLINDSKIDSPTLEFHPSYETTEKEQSLRKSRHIHTHKNHPYNYYYSKNQPEKCKQEYFLEKCRKRHQKISEKNKHYTKLVLHVGSIPCICPPPENEKVNIISPLIDYTYTEDQHPDCKSKNALKGCQDYHHKLQKNKKKYANVLMFSIKNNLCYCPPLDDRLVNIIPPKKNPAHLSRKENITRALTQNEEQLIEHKKKRIISNSEKKQSVKSDNDIVTIVKMYDFSCIDDHEDVTFNDVLKIISKTLRNPIASLSSESAIIHRYNTLHLGCPSKNTMDKINDIAISADKFLSILIQVLPDFKSIMLLQNVLSPILMAISQDLEGKDIDIDLINEINSNIIFVFQDSVRAKSLSDVKKIGLMTADGMKKYVTNNLNDKFKIRSDGLGILYLNKFFNLKFDLKNRPYIVIDGKSIFVGYNVDNNEWERLNSDQLHFYSDENIYNVNKYSVNNVYENDLYNIDNINELLKVRKWLSTDEVAFDHVFFGEKIVPVYKITLSSGEETYVTAVLNLPKKIIVRTPYGFVFDKESTEISYTLGLYVENNIHGHYLDEENVYSKIHDDKLSYDNNGNPYLKYKNIYYPVELYDKKNNIYSMSSENNDEEVYIKIKGKEFDFHENNFFDIQELFKKDPSLLSKIIDGHFDKISSSYSITSVMSKDQYSGYIDFHTYAKLLTNGQVLDLDTTEFNKVDSLIYRDEKSRSYFLNINDKFYSIEIKPDHDRVLLIKNKNPNKSDMEVYHYDDLLLQIKEEKFQVEYSRLSNCRVRRNIGDDHCIPIYISSSLSRKLDKNIHGSYSFPINDDDIKISDDGSGFFYRKGKEYYYYKHRFFEVKINPGNTARNKFSDPVVDVYTKSIFNNKRKIASFIVVNKKDRIELKEPSVFLAENTGNEIDDMQFLLENKKYYNIPNIFEINNAINEVNRAKQLKIIAPKEHPDISVDYKKIVDYCYKNFYNGNNDIKFNILEMDQITSEHDESVLLDRLNIQLHLISARDIVTKAIAFIQKPSDNLNEYLKSILNTDSNTIIRQFSEHLRIAFELTLLKLDSKFIYLVSAVKEPYDNVQLSNVNANVKSPIHYKRVLDDTSLRTGTFAFTTKIKNPRIYICTDKFYLIDPTHPDNAMHHVNELDLTETLIHEATHAGYGTDDSYYMPHEFDGALGSLMKSKDMFINKIPKAEDKYHQALINMAKEYIERISLYERWKDRLLTDKTALSFFVSKDIGIMSNIYLKNADFLTKICKDIYSIDVVDKYKSDFYSSFIDMGSILTAPVLGFLDRAEDEVIADIGSVYDSFPSSSGKITPLDTINEEEGPAAEESLTPNRQPLNSKTSVHFP